MSAASSWTGRGMTGARIALAAAGIGCAAVALVLRRFRRLRAADPPTGIIFTGTGASSPCFTLIVVPPEPMLTCGGVKGGVD